MCGRYALALRASQVRQMLQDDDLPVDDAPEDEGDGAPRQSYNFAPGYHGIVYRAAVPDWGAGPAPHANDDADADADDDDDAKSSPVKSNKGHSSTKTSYKLQSMRWGLIPFWTKRNPDYASMMKTINCRDDSLGSPGGMWATMKARKRCIVVAQGFFEWLKTGPKDKLPHYVRRKDGRLMCFAGLWDCVQYEGSEEKTYTYTIITTDSNAQLKFLHDRMPVILEPGSEAMRTWLDPAKHAWDRELQSLLRPFAGELDVYPVTKDVGKVGNNSPSFIIPLDSKENKSNIANFFANAQRQKKGGGGGDVKGDDAQTVKVKTEGPFTAVKETAVKEEKPHNTDTGQEENPHAADTASREKRKAAPTIQDEPLLKKPALDRKKISPSENERKEHAKAKEPGLQKITRFFGNSA